MIIKKIMCNVKEGCNETFHKQQEQWYPLREVEGFLGQIGGWSITHPSTAYVYAFWENQAAYDRFMEKEHDAIFIDSFQENSYDSIDVRLYEERLQIPGLAANIVNVVRKSNYIRVAVSEVKHDRIQHFVETQADVWNVGMQKSDGMLGGTFASSEQESNAFLVLTGWDSDEHHQRYRVENFPDLYHEAKPENDVVDIIGHWFRVEEGWRVCPKDS